MKFSPRYATFYPNDMLSEALPEDVIDVQNDVAFRAQHLQFGETLVVTAGVLYVVASTESTAL